jgi:hypothetical protein
LKKDAFKRKQSLNDATSGQLVEELRANNLPDHIVGKENSRQKAARKISRDG